MRTIYQRTRAVLVTKGKWREDPSADLRYVPVKVAKGVRTGDIKGPFYIRFTTADGSKRKQHWTELQAQTFADARKEIEREDAPPVEPSALLRSAVAAYIAEIRANKAPRTWLVYRRSLELFQESCHKPNVADVGRSDLLEFKTYLKGQGFSGRTIYNNFLNVTIFFASVRQLCGR